MFTFLSYTYGLGVSMKAMPIVHIMNTRPAQREREEAFQLYDNISRLAENPMIVNHS